MKHTELDALVADAARQAGARAFHWQDSTRCTARGWPDWTLLTPGRLAFVEVKAATTMSPEQTAVRYALESCGLAYRIIRPHQAGDIPDIIRTLTHREAT